MSHNTAITHFETDFPLSNNQNCLPECDREKENVLKDLKNKMDSISNNTPRIDNAIEATKKLIFIDIAHQTKYFILQTHLQIKPPLLNL